MAKKTTPKTAKTISQTTKKKQQQNSKIISPHDKFFKMAFSIVEVVENFLKCFLDKNLLNMIDLSKLEPDDTAYISGSLQETFSDKVWRTRLKSWAVEILFLLEHKSFLEAHVYEQLLGYQLSIWAKQRQQAKNDGLPPPPNIVALPFVLYHGEANWDLAPFAKSFGDLPQEFLRYVPTSEIIYVNLSKLTDEEILRLEGGLLVNVLLLFRHYHDPDYLLEKAEILWAGLRERCHKKDPYWEFIVAYLNYYINLMSKDKEKQEKIFNKIETHFSMDNNVIYDFLHDRAVLYGEKRGEERGEEKTRLEAINEMWEDGLLMPKIAKFMHLTIAQVQQYMRKIVGQDTMLLVEQQWGAGLTTDAIAANMDLDIAFIQRIVDYVLNYEQVGEKKDFEQE
jgi:predicted transposase YdaD